MRPVEVKITRFIAGRAGAVLLMALSLVACLAAFGSAQSLPSGGDAGIACPTFLDSIASHTVRFSIGLGLTAAVTALMDSINRTFNLLRTTQLLFLGVFAALQCASPVIINSQPSAVLLNLVVLGVMATFFTTYQQPSSTKRVFLAFVIMSALALGYYPYLVYILLGFTAFSQMRCVGPRMILAAVLGIITPVWIALGFGWLTFADFHLPHPASIFDSLPRPRLIILIVTVGLTVISSFLLCAVNMVKIYAYNAKDRALNALLMMQTLVTAVAVLVDVRNSPMYLSLLNCLLAFQTGLFFRVNAARRGYIVVLAILFILTVIYFCNLWL